MTSLRASSVVRAENEGGDASVSLGAHAFAIVCYLVVSELSESLATQAAGISAFWPPAGVGLALALLFNWRILPAIWLGAFLTNVIDLSPETGVTLATLTPGWWSTSLIDASLAVVSAVLGWLLLARAGGAPYPFNRVRHVVVFIVGSACLASAVTALGGCLMLLVNGSIGWPEFGMTWATWATGDAVGILVVAPVLLAFGTGEQDGVRVSLAWFLELLAVLGSIALVAIPVAYDLPLEYLALLPLLWASFRLGLKGASVAVAAVAGASVVIDIGGHGYFARFDPAVSMLLVQTFVGAVALVPLMLIPTLVERQHAAVREAKVNQDLALARSIQQALLPVQAPSCDGFDIDGWNCPADETGGDYYDWLSTTTSRVLLVLGDVTGHGVGPALVAAASRSYVRAIASGEREVGRLLTRVNELIAEDLPGNRFITMAAVLIDDASGEVHLRSAGQGPICVYRAGGHEVDIMRADDPPIGIMGDYEFGEARRIELEPGDVLVLMTDGFIEWANPHGEMYGIERFVETLRQSSSLSAREIIEALNHDVREFASDVEQPDDLTAVVIKRRAYKAGAGS
ncbi:MAG: SpoIIE family protein phosphatase [Phycisphaerales bacterium JB043]